MVLTMYFATIFVSCILAALRLAGLTNFPWFAIISGFVWWPILDRLLVFCIWGYFQFKSWPFWRFLYYLGFHTCPKVNDPEYDCVYFDGYCPRCRRYLFETEQI